MPKYDEDVQIRPGGIDDLPALVEIYNHYVTNSHVTFDTETFAVEERRAWFDGFASSGAHRLLVATVDTTIAGYASSKELRPKPAYGRSVETTIYLRSGFDGRGIGGRLYGELLELMTAEEETHRAFAGIALPNDASIALHERLDFEILGTFHEVGYKFGKYWDVSWYERSLRRTV